MGDVCEYVASVVQGTIRHCDTYSYNVRRVLDHDETATSRIFYMNVGIDDVDSAVETINRMNNWNMWASPDFQITVVTVVTSSNH